MMTHSSGASYQNRYPYSTKIICEEHGTTFHRQVLTNKSGSIEAWQCKVYRTKGRAACSAPQIRSCDLDPIMAQIFTELVEDKEAVIDSLITVLTSIPKEVDYDQLISCAEAGIAATRQKKHRLLDLHIDGSITTAEFKERNDSLNDRLKEQEDQLATIRVEQAKAAPVELDIPAIRKELEKTLSFEGEIDSALVTTILDKVVVKKESTKEEIHLDIFLKLGQKYEAVYGPKTPIARINPPKNTTPRGRIRRI